MSCFTTFLTDDHFKFERVSLTYTPNIDNVCLLSSDDDRRIVATLNHVGYRTLSGHRPKLDFALHYWTITLRCLSRAVAGSGRSLPLINRPPRRVSRTRLGHGETNSPRAYIVRSTSVIVRPFRVVPGADNPWSPGVLRSRPQTPHHSTPEQRQWGVRF